MAFDTIIQQGRFTSTGAAVTLALRSDVDWIRVYNETALAQAAADLAYEFYFQRGMAAGRGIAWTKLGTVANDPVTIGQLAANTGFTLIDSSVITPSGNTAITAVTAANPPVVSTATTPVIGDIVRLNTLDNQPQIGGIDFTVTAINAGVDFTIGNINLTNSTASTAGNYRIIPFDPMFYPRNRTVTFIQNNVVNPKVYLSVTHGFTVGQELRLSFPGGSALWGDYAQLDGVSATVLAVGVARAGNEPNNAGVANNVQLDIDTTGFAAWNTFGAGGNEGYVAAGDVPFTPAQLIPIGQDTAQSIVSAVDILADATNNQAVLGIRLAGGATGPGGAANDVMYWMAGKSFNVDNQ